MWTLGSFTNFGCLGAGRGLCLQKGSVITGSMECKYHKRWHAENTCQSISLSQCVQFQKESSSELPYYNWFGYSEPWKRDS